MIRGALVLALLLVGCGGGARTLKLGEAPAHVDEVMVVDKTMSTNTELSGEGTVVNGVSSKHDHYERKVLEMEGALVTRIAVFYEIQETSSANADSAPVVEQGPLAGKRFEVWRDGDVIDAKHADGTPITAEERSGLNQEFRRLGRTDRAEVLLRDRAWKRDVTVALDAEMVEALGLGADDTNRFREGTITWTGTDGNVATFRTVAAFDHEGGGEIQLSGDVFVDRTSARELGGKGTAIVRGKLSGWDMVQTIELTETVEVR